MYLEETRKLRVCTASKRPTLDVFRVKFGAVVGHGISRILCYWNNSTVVKADYREKNLGLPLEAFVLQVNLNDLTGNFQ